MPAFGKGSSASYTWTMKTNFGNGYLGTDTVGTTNQDAANIGYFKYAVPTGYYAFAQKILKLTEEFNYGRIYFISTIRFF